MQISSGSDVGLIGKLGLRLPNVGIVVSFVYGGLQFYKIEGSLLGFLKENVFWPDFETLHFATFTETV